MAVAATIQGFNVGSDVSFAITDQYGDVFSDAQMGLLTQFDLRSVDVKMKVTPISNSGIPVLQTIPNGLRGTMTFVRTGPSFGQLYLDTSQGYYGAGLITQMTIMMLVRNRNGSVDEYQILGTQLSDWDFGDFRGTKEVDCKVAIEASQMVGSGTLANFLNNLPG